MTRRLRRYNRHLSVQLLGNRAVSLTVDEQALVAVSAPVGMCREVILHGDGGPAILGWTLFAEAALQGGSRVHQACPGSVCDLGREGDFVEGEVIGPEAAPGRLVAGFGIADDEVHDRQLLMRSTMAPQRPSLSSRPSKPRSRW